MEGKADLTMLQNYVSAVMPPSGNVMVSTCGTTAKDAYCSKNGGGVNHGNAAKNCGRSLPVLQIFDDDFQNSLKDVCAGSRTNKPAALPQKPSNTTTSISALPSLGANLATSKRPVYNPKKRNVRHGAETGSFNVRMAELFGDDDDSEMQHFKPSPPLKVRKRLGRPSNSRVNPAPGRAVVKNASKRPVTSHVSGAGNVVLQPQVRSVTTSPAPRCGLGIAQKRIRMNLEKPIVIHSDTDSVDDPIFSQEGSNETFNAFLVALDAIKRRRREAARALDESLQEEKNALNEQQVAEEQMRLAEQRLRDARTRVQRAKQDTPRHRAIIEEEDGRLNKIRQRLEL